MKSSLFGGRVSQRCLRLCLIVCMLFNGGLALAACTNNLVGNLGDFGTINIPPNGVVGQDLPARRIITVTVICPESMYLDVNDTAFVRTGSGSYGAAPRVPGLNNVWETGIPGIGLKINVFRINGRQQSLSSTDQASVPVDSTLPLPISGNRKQLVVDYDVSLVRTAAALLIGNRYNLDVSLPTVNEAGHIGTYGGFLTGTIVVGNPTCNIDTASASVTLNNVAVQDFASDVTSIAATAPFVVNATCGSQSGTSPIYTATPSVTFQYTFMDAHPYSRTGLTNTQLANIGSATGVALELRRNDDASKTLQYCNNSTDLRCWQVADNTPGDTQYTITLRPYYVKTGAAIAAGNVSAGVNFSLVYR